MTVNRQQMEIYKNPSSGTNPESYPISDSGVVRSPLNLNKNQLHQIETLIRENVLVQVK